MLDGRESVTVADYKALRYTMRCINESMRLYPHPPVLLRRANVPDQLPGNSAAPRLARFQDRLFATCLTPPLAPVLSAGISAPVFHITYAIKHADLQQRHAREYPNIMT